MTVPPPAELGELATELAIAASGWARTWRAEGFQVAVKSSPTDLVTEVDGRVERFIADELRRRRPNDRILGEEGARSAAGETSPVRWLVDPIDGTVNFTLGYPYYGVSIAAEVQGRVVAGCVVNPVSGDVFRGVAGAGAFLHPGGRAAETVRLRGPREVALDRAVIGTGFGYDALRRGRQGQVVAALLPRIGDIRRVGAASLDLCAVAAGWLDGYFEAGLNAWDYAAGLLIATEAGCVSSGLAGRAAGDEFCAVAGPVLAPRLFALLAEHGADQVG